MKITDEMIDSMAKVIAFAGRDRMDRSEDAEEFWAYTGDQTRAVLRKQAAAVLALSASPAGVGVETEAEAPLTQLEMELLTALKRFRDTIIGEVHDKWDEGMRAGKLIVALANPTLPYRRDITEIHEAIAKAEARAALATTEGQP